ncbi:hypothetical protein QN277_000658 [Acacia crassicarpa]|uniref:Uncharacterized protein n=1 Tax=Acacia crassicarpa TaxID=499986 RepID=A0AAE1N6M9_9FABA|nr:hypothetical protein QN277_000658 [Acacia crassicarpa]
MKGTSKVIMGATLIMVVTLAVVLGLILVLLTELYCSLLLRRRRHLRTSATASTSTTAATTIRTNALPSSPTSHPRQHHHHPPPPPPPSLFTSIYAQGVLQAPRNFLSPLVSSREELTVAKKQLVELHHQAIQIQTRDLITSPRHLGLLSASSSPPQPIQGAHDSVQGSNDTSKETICGEHLVYISNPIYENDDESKGSSGSDTPFQTPHTSPSRLETFGSSGEDEAALASPSCNTPPLSPMKKLPAEASSVSLKDATTSLGNSGSVSHSSSGRSSTSSATPCTSPSW